MDYTKQVKHRVNDEMPSDRDREDEAGCVYYVYTEYGWDNSRLRQVLLYLLDVTYSTYCAYSYLPTYQIYIRYDQVSQ